MFDISVLAGRVAGLFSLAAFVPYILSTLRGRTKPNRATWWIWTVVGSLLAVSYYASGARPTLWVALSYVLGPLITAILSFRYGVGGWTRFDRGCMLGAGVGALLWWAFSSPLIALLINLGIDFLGALPTLFKAYSDPGGEDSLAWSLFLLGNTLNLFAIDQWRFSIVVYPAYMFLLSALILLLLTSRRRVKQDLLR
ncbi:MAG: hypothetical protein LAO31_03740 [Acidobacteriia bacterium]|nr:hypothetical protein [Terriglobia bacterium]